MSKFFSITPNGAYTRINMLGIKFNILNIKQMYNIIKDLQNDLKYKNKQIENLNVKLKLKQKMIDDINIALAWTIRGKIFLYSNLDKFSIEDKIWFLSQNFYKKAGYFPNFKKPKSFNEKINWLKLNYNNPNEAKCIDKYEFKHYVNEKLGGNYVIPLIGVYNDVNEIDFNSLPDKFVIKITTYGAGMGIEIVKDKNKIDIDKIKYKFNNLLRKWNGCYYSIFANGYKNIKPRIIIEEYVEELEQANCDYKFFCFNGKVKCLYIANNWAINSLHEEKSATYYDLNGNPLPFVYDNYKRCEQKLSNIDNFNKMVEISENLSSGYPFVRVDFFNFKNKILLSEMTFTPGGGFGKYDPVEWDYKLGEWLDLSKLNPEYLNILPEFAKAAENFIDPNIVRSHTVEREITSC